MGRRLPYVVRRAALIWLAPSAIVVVGLVNLSHLAHSPSYPGSPAKHIAFLGVAAAALGIRRYAPLVGPTVAIAVVTWWTSLWPATAQGPFEGFVVLVGAAYCLGTIRERRGWRVGGAVLVLWFALGLVVGIVGGRVGDVFPVAVWLTIGFVVGTLIGRRTEQARSATESARVLATEQQRRIEHAVEDERARIARELHDVVAHSLSVIVVQAGAERRASWAATDAVDRESIDVALGSIEKAGREALIDLRRLLGLLRRPNEPLSLAPQPGLSQLDELVSTARDSGLQVALELSGDTSPLPPGLDLTAYRIVQEALTNTLKHANAQTVRVAISRQRNLLDVEVSDDGRPTDKAPMIGEGAGQGLIGMRERVKIFGGTISAGAGPTGGWSVHARLPVTAGSAS
jgi:signal transduction histidine kinase